MAKSKKTEPTEIRYGVHPSPFGKFFIAATSRGVCAASFLGNGGVGGVVRGVKKDWPRATVIRDDSFIQQFHKKIFSHSGKKVSIPLVLQGTDFQIKVWDALLAIPEGKTMTYAEVAKKIGSPKAVRAVGSACGKNTIAFLIPCHRVLTSAGGLGGYRWGKNRKEAILAWESLQ